MTKRCFFTQVLLVSKSAKNQVLALNPGGLMKKHKKSMVINKKTKHLDCRPALNPLRILLGEILGRFWKDFGRKILPKSCKMLINLDLGRLQALKISSNRLRDLQQISGISGISKKSQGAKMRFQNLRFSAKKIWRRWTHR